MTKFWYNIILCIMYTNVIAFIIGVIKYPGLDKKFRVVFYYLLYSIVNGVVMHVLSAKQINNLLFYNLFIIIEFLFLSLFLLLSFKKQFQKRLIYFTLFFFSIILILSAKLSQGYFNILQMFGTIALFSFGLLLTLNIVNSKSQIPVNKHPLFWMGSGIVLYSAPSFLIALSTNQILTLPMKQAYILWIIKSVFWGIFILFISIAFLRCSKT